MIITSFVLRETLGIVFYHFIISGIKKNRVQLYPSLLIHRIYFV